MTHQKIEQHFYTRERRGLFRPSEGYDTVARSAGLSDVYIKEAIHPFCVFPGAGERSLTVIHYPCGKMLLGQGAYIAKDFTGQRPAFFQHNFIIPPQKAGAVIRDFPSVLRGVQFETAYDIEKGGGLPQLEELPCAPAAAPPANPPAMDFHHLIHCLAQSVNTHKKTYIFVPPGSTHDVAVTILSALYPRLPAPLAQVLGFCTYAREPYNKKGLHLVFIESGAVLPSDPRLKGHFFVDFTKESGIIASSEFFIDRFLALTDRDFCGRIFGEIDFWLARDAQIANSDGFIDAVRNRTAAILDSLLQCNAAEIKAIPDDFLRRGLSGWYAHIIGHAPADFLTLEILKRAAMSQIKREPEALRYFLGSYRLAPPLYKKLYHTLQGGHFYEVLAQRP